MSWNPTPPAKGNPRYTNLVEDFLTKNRSVHAASGVFRRTWFLSVWYTVPVPADFDCFDLWKEIGYNTIIFLAALTSIDPGLYEAAAIDGAGRFKQVLYISIPSLMGMVLLLTLLGIGSIMSAGFDQVYMLYSPAIWRGKHTTEPWKSEKIPSAVWIKDYFLQKISRQFYGKII